MNNFNKKFPGQNFGQNGATENVAANTVTTEVAEVSNNKTGILTKKNMVIVGGIALAVAIATGVVVYKKKHSGKKATEETTADPQNDFEEAK